jgi:short-subunit dehydrogenase
MHKQWKQRYGTWAVVTGASSGIGKEMARQLAAAGMNLLLVARRAGELDALRAELESTWQVEAVSVPLDLTAQGAASSVAEIATGRDVGLLVNAAGFGLGGTMLNHALEDELAMVDLNCRASFELTYLFARRFVARGGGGIILFSSIVAFQGVPRSANYAATKAYIQSLGEALADELAPHKIDVLVTQPGPTESGFAARAGMTMGKAENPATVAAQTLAALGHKSRVTPGTLSKVLLWSLSTAPRALRVRIMKAIMQSMT